MQNQCNSGKAVLVKAVLNMTGVRADLPIHDDTCHVELSVEKNHPDAFASIRFWVIDAFHCPNHSCQKRIWTVAEKGRCKGVRTHVSESFNAWVRSLKFFTNGLRPLSHIFWMHILQLSLAVCSRSDCAEDECAGAG